MTATLYMSSPSNKLLLNPIAAPTYERGKLVYDTDPEAETVTFFNVETETEIHFGRETQIPVRNNSGATINPGQAVYINGNHPGTKLPTVALALANSFATAQCCGIAAHSIENNTIGYVYVIGLAHHNIDTTAFANGDVLYLSATIPGGLTATKPDFPNYIVRIGIVTRASANGAIHVLIGTPEEARVGGLSVASTGFITSGDISVVAGSFVALGAPITIRAVAGNVLELNADSILCASAGSDIQFDAATRVSGADANWFSSGTNTSRFPGGIGDWYVATGSFDSQHSPVRYTVQAGDVVANQVTVQLYGRVAGGSRTVFANATYPLRVNVTNLSVGD